MATQNEIDLLFNPVMVMTSSAFIKSPTEGSPELQACEALFRARYWELLSYAKWPFAMKRVDLTFAQNNSGGDFKFKADLAASGNPLHADATDRFVRTAELVPRSGQMDKAPLFWEEGDSIYHNVGTGTGTSFTMIYIAAVPVEKIRGPFLLILQKSIAAELASKFLQNENMARRLWVEMTAHLRMALQTVTPFSDLPGTSLDTIYAVGNPQG